MGLQNPDREFESHRALNNLPQWRNGIRSGLRNRGLRTCGFDSHLRYICSSGGIGIHGRFKPVRALSACRFESYLEHNGRTSRLVTAAILKIAELKGLGGSTPSSSANLRQGFGLRSNTESKSHRVGSCLLSSLFLARNVVRVHCFPLIKGK
jgi:hypothetical protein